MKSTIKSEKYLKTLIILSSLTFVVVLGIGVFFFKDRYDARKQESEQHKESLKWVIHHMRNTYKLLKDNAPWYNEKYARLTMNSSRDTIAHSRYTVEEFSRMHSELMRTMDVFERNIENKNRFYSNQLKDILPISYESQHLMGTFRIRDELYSKIDRLDEAFAEGMNDSAPTDTMPQFPLIETSKFSRYFKTLKKIDDAYYNLLAYRMPDGLSYLTKMHPDFIADAKHLAFTEHLYELINAHESAKDTSALFSTLYKVNRCDSFTTDCLTTFALQTRHVRELLMIRTEKSLKNMSSKEKEAFVQKVFTCTDNTMGIMEDPYVYVITNEGDEFFAENPEGPLRPLDDLVKEELLSFYDDLIGRYYIEGSFDPHAVFYPNE